MDLLKTATDWAREEVFSASFFIVFGIAFVLASAGFWHLGKSDLARAYIYPTLIAGILLLIIGIGLVYANVMRIDQFAEAFQSDAMAFLESELARCERTLNEYQTIVFKGIPFIIAAAALTIVFVDKPLWRAISITTIAMMVVILLIDGTAHARIDSYNKQLLEVNRDALK